VVLEGGGAITMGEWLPDPDAVLLVWYPGQMGGHAIADLLLGGANPSGKLPITFPTGLEQLPPFDNVSDEVTYGYFHGYRYLDLNGDVPQFPFGFGLSYTTFALANLRSSQSTARPGEWVAFSVDVTNTGNRTGAEVIQLYVSYPESAVERAERELKAFQKIELEPGQTQTVTLDLAVDDLRYYDPESSAWLLEELEYVIRVGSSSRELPLTSSLAVESTERDE
jgi:beta-glucosidase